MQEKTDYMEEIERPIVVFETSLGAFEAELYAKECPETVWNFINLAEGRQQTEKGGNFYDGLTFHRVIQLGAEAGQGVEDGALPAIRLPGQDKNRVGRCFVRGDHVFRPVGIASG